MAPRCSAASTLPGQDDRLERFLGRLLRGKAGPLVRPLGTRLPGMPEIGIRLPKPVPVARGHCHIVAQRGPLFATRQPLRPSLPPELILDNGRIYAILAILE